MYSLEGKARWVGKLKEPPIRAIRPEFSPSHTNTVSGPGGRKWFQLPQGFSLTPHLTPTSGFTAVSGRGGREAGSLTDVQIGRVLRLFISKGISFSGTEDLVILHHPTCLFSRLSVKMEGNAGMTVKPEIQVYLGKVVWRHSSLMTDSVMLQRTNPLQDKTWRWHYPSVEFAV